MGEVAQFASRRMGMGFLAALLLVAPIFQAADGPVRLKLEERTTLRVGQIATLRMPSQRPCHISSAGDALALIKPANPAGAAVEQAGGEAVRVIRSTSAAVLVYRAVRPGEETIVVTPSKSPDGCIDCAARHCFVTVLPASR